MKKAGLIAALLLVVALGVSLVSAPAVVANGGVQIQVAMILDGSGSISSTNWGIMLEGLATAVNSSECVPHDGSVELTIIQFSDWAQVELGPVVITEANAADLADAVRNITQLDDRTCISCGFCLAADTVYNSTNFDPSLKQAINLVTDGDPNECSCSGSTCGYTDATGCSSLTDEDSAVCARDYLINKLGMTADQDEIDAEFIGSRGDTSDWLRDDIVWPGDGYYLNCQTRVPTGDGDVSGTWNPSTGTDRYACVNETVPDDTDYITGTTDGGGYCLFDFDSFDVPDGASIDGLIIHVRADQPSSGTNDIRARIAVNGTYYEDTYNEVYSGWDSYDHTWTTNPDTGLDWTVADIEGTGSNPIEQFGVYSTDLDPDVMVSMVYAEVCCSVPIHVGPGWVRQFDTWEEFVPSICEKFEIIVEEECSLNVISDGCCNITVEWDLESATVDASHNQTFTKMDIPCGTNVILTADDADPCCVFDYWTGNVTGAPNSTNPITITMEGAKEVVAHCHWLTYNLTVVSDGCCPVAVDFLGSVDAGETDAFTDIDCCTNLTLSAFNSSSCGFVQWTVDGGEPTTASNTIIVHMDANHTATVVCNATVIGDTVFYDNIIENGHQDPGEGGVAGVTVRLYKDNGDQAWDPGTDNQLAGSNTTDGAGEYLFSDIEAGCYWVLVDESTLPAGVTLPPGSNPYFVCVEPGGSYMDADFPALREIPEVGGEAYLVNRLFILAPWIALAVLLAGGIGWYVLRRRRAQS